MLLATAAVVACATVSVHASTLGDGRTGGKLARRGPCAGTRRRRGQGPKRRHCLVLQGRPSRRHRGPLQPGLDVCQRARHDRATTLSQPTSSSSQPNKATNPPETCWRWWGKQTSKPPCVVQAEAEEASRLATERAGSRRGRGSRGSGQGHQPIQTPDRHRAGTARHGHRATPRAPVRHSSGTGLCRHSCRVQLQPAGRVREKCARPDAADSRHGSPVSA